MKWLAVLGLLFLSAPVQAESCDMLVIAHRGASGERPEHTLAAYELAIDQGADYIEPDLVSTSDGVLVARHENEISGTTDVADHPEFADRRTTKLIDGEEISGWFTEDFTIAELQTLRARERLPDLRPTNTEFDGRFSIPTLAEIIALVEAKETESGRRIGLYPELKHPTHFRSEGIDLAGLLLAQLEQAGIDAGDPVFIQCFEIGTLAQIASQTDIPLIQLIAAEGGPADLPQLDYATMITPAGLASVAIYADGIGVDLRLVLAQDGSATSLVADAHAAGLKIHGWTVRRENNFLPAALRSGDDPAAPGNIAGLVALLSATGIDGVFTDNPADVIGAR